MGMLPMQLIFFNAGMRGSNPGCLPITFQHILTVAIALVK
jgi:hypothetical protein